MRKLLLLMVCLLTMLAGAVEVINFGVPGLTVKGVSGSRLKNIDAHKADVAVIMLGREEMRNAKKLRTPEEFAADYAAMLKIFKKLRCPVVIINILPVTLNGEDQMSRNILKANELIKKLADAENIPVVDIYSAVWGARNSAPAEYLKRRTFSAADSAYLARMTAVVLKKNFPNAQKIICIGGEEVYGYRLPGAGTNSGETFPAQLKLQLNMVDAATLLPPAGKPLPGRFSSRAKWIWYPESFLQRRNVTKIFRKNFTLTELPVSANFICSGDDRVQIFINGEKVAAGDWKPGVRGDAATFLKNGKNIIAVEVLNVAVDGGMIFRMDMKFADNRSMEIVSDESWKSFSPEAGCTAVEFSEINGEKPWIIGDAGAFPWARVDGFDYLQYLALDELARLKKMQAAEMEKFALIRQQLSNEPKRQYKVRYLNSRAGIDDGKNFFPAMIYHTSSFLLEDYRTFNYLVTMRDAGYKLFYIPMNLENLWESDGSVNLPDVEKRLLALLSVVPDARIIVGIGMNPPEWYVNQNLSEIVGYSREGANPAFRNKDQQRALRMSYASEKWRGDCAAAVTRIIRHLEDSPLASRIFGYAPHCGVYNTEWHYFGMRNEMPDNGTAMTAEFRKFLRQRYNNDVAVLRKAWKDENVTFNTAQVPGAEARSFRPHGALRIASDNQAVIDYLLCHQKVVADTVLFFDRIAKEACNNRALVGNYFGYILEMNFPTEGWHLENLRVLDSPYVDFQISPYGYGDFRMFGASGTSRTMTTAYRLRNKLLIYEDDTRTHLNTVSGGHYANTPEESAALLMRGFGFSLTDGCGIWYLDFNRGWFEHPLLKEAQKIMHQVRDSNLPGGSVAEVALVTDLESVIHHTYSDNKVPALNKSLLDGTILELGQSAVPHDTLWLQDLGKKGLPDYKVYIFCNILKFTPERAALIKKLRDSGKTLIWLYAPGVIKDGEISLESVNELTGFKVKMLPVKSDVVTVISSGTLPGVNAGYRMVPRHRYGLSDVPVFVLDDPAAKELGKAEIFGSNYTTLGMKNHGGGFSVIHTVPRMDRTVLMGLLKQAGVHLYLTDAQKGDVLFADKSFIVLHSDRGGKREVQLPAAANVRELYPENKALTSGKVRKFTVDLPAESTTLLVLE